jgi:lambda repressor-like predicted transcriptional regulator
VDLLGRLSNPRKITETLAAQGSERIVGSGEGVESAQIEPSDDHAEGPREEMGRLSNPPQRRLSLTDIDRLIKAYRAGASISQLAIEFGIHRTTLAGHLDRHGVPRHREQTAWDDEILNEAAELYESGLSLAAVGAQFGIDAQTVANRFRRVGVAVRPRRGWTSRNGSERERC